jgi:outer membrane protein OmpA-like peptidoglycan-associated protein
MAELEKPPQSNSSRTVVIVVVAVLIVVAIAGIVLAGRKAPPAPEAGTASTPATSTGPAASGSTPGNAGSPTDPVPKNVMFAAGSDKLPAAANEGLARFAEAARGSASAVRLSARFVTGANKERDRELAKARAGAIRHQLEANGVNTGKMQIELIEMPEGVLTPEAGNRIDLSLR